MAQLKDTKITGNAEITGNTSIIGTLGVSSNASISGHLGASSAHVGGNLSTDGTANFHSMVTVDNTLVVATTAANSKDLILKIGTDHSQRDPDCYIQAFDKSNGVKTLRLNPAGGAVEIGNSSTIKCNGDLSVSGNLDPKYLWDAFTVTEVAETDWDKATGTNVIQLGFKDYLDVSIKFKAVSANTADNDSTSPKMNIALDGTLWVNEGQNKVLDRSNLAGTTSGQKYHIYADSTDSNLYVDVPWTDSDTLYEFQTPTTQGHYKVNGTEYPVANLQTNSSPKFSSIQFNQTGNTSDAPPTTGYQSVLRLEGCNTVKGGYASIIGFNGHGDGTGGGAHQLAFSQGSVYHRYNPEKELPSDKWTSWEKFIIQDSSGNVSVTNQITAQSFNALSDARLKENFQPLKTEKSILDLPTYKFDFIAGAKNQIGCKAQDLQEICPEIVDEGTDGYLSIQESKIVYLLLEEVKKLRKEIDELKGV